VKKKTMKKGDRAFSSLHEAGIVGSRKSSRRAYPDTTDKPASLFPVRPEADRAIETPVTMAAIKADNVSDMALENIRGCRFTRDGGKEWKLVCNGRD